MPTENLRLDLVFLEFQDECNAILGEDWVDEAKASLAACTGSARTALQVQLLPFVLAAGIYWLGGKKMGYRYHAHNDPVRLVLERVRACLRINPDLCKPEPGPDGLSFMVELLHSAAAEPIPNSSQREQACLREQAFLQELSKDQLCQRCLDLIAERDSERAATVESLRELTSKLEMAKAQLEEIARTPLPDQSEEQPGMPSLSDESLQGLSKAELRQRCIQLSDQLNIGILHYESLADKHRLLGVEHDKVEAQRRQAVADRAAMSSSLTQALHRADVVGEDYAKLSTQYAKAMTRRVALENQRDWLLGALGALEHPDGVIRGPLLDGPELDVLNVVIASIRKSGPDDRPRDGSTTIHVPPGAEAYVYIYEDGEGDAPAPYERDKVVVAAERLLNVTGERGLALEDCERAFMAPDDLCERNARHALHDAIMHIKTPVPESPPYTRRQAVVVAAKQLLLCTKARDIDLSVRLEHNSLTPEEVCEWNARRQLIFALGVTRWSLLQL